MTVVTNMNAISGVFQTLTGRHWIIRTCMEKLFMDALATGIESRGERHRLARVEEELDQFGCATVAHLLTPRNAMR